MQLCAARASLLLALSACGSGSGAPTRDAGTVHESSVEQQRDAAVEDAGSAADAESIASADLADVYARAAVVLGSCWPDDGVNRNAGYLWEAASIPQMWGTLRADAACLAGHGGGCSAVRACTGYLFSLDANPCEIGCKGEVYSECDGEQYRLSLDCGHHGFACDDDKVCVQRGAVPCDEASYTLSCDAEGRPNICFRGFTLRGPSCAALGLVCEASACRGAGESCIDYFSSGGDLGYVGLGCQGDTLTACVGSKQHERNCADIAPGFSCQEFEGIYFCGLDSACLPGELPNADQRGTLAVCKDDILRFCNAGRVEEIACTSLGFDGCGEDGETCGPLFPVDDITR